VETIRYYERENLLPEPARSDGNYRLYTQAHAERLTFIRNCRTLDMTLEEIRSLLRLRDSPQDQCGSVNALIDEHIQHVQARIDGLLALQAQLLDLRQRCGEGGIDQCGILQRLETKGRCRCRRPSIRMWAVATGMKTPLILGRACSRWTDAAFRPALSLHPRAGSLLQYSVRLQTAIGAVIGAWCS
jgi:Cd(II)/Pb(II)-responsive transcriptional regulator